MNPFMQNLEKKTYTIELLTEMLGTVPKNPEVYAAHIIAKAKEISEKSGEELDAEVETVESVEEKGWTGFMTDDEGIFIYEHMILGFLKSSCEVAQTSKIIKKLPAYKKWMDKIVLVTPRKIRLKNKPDGTLERPLRAKTAQGPRVTVTRSDFIDVGTRISFEISVLPNEKRVDQKLIETLLQYGEICGLGQWRGSGGYGRFKLIK